MQRKGKRIMILGVIVLLLFCAIITLTVNYKTFIQGKYETIYMDEDEIICITIPKYSFIYKKDADYYVHFYTLSSEEQINSLMNQLLSNYEPVVHKATGLKYYYNPDTMLVIYDYRINLGEKRLIFNSFTIGYSYIYNENEYIFE